MSKVATTREATIWQCDNCQALKQTPSAFDRPNGWWTISFERQLTHVEVRAAADYCQKDCVLDGLRYHNYADTEHPKAAQS